MVDNTRHRKPTVAVVIPDDDIAQHMQPSVTAVISTSSNPVAYMPANDSNVFKGDSNSDDSVSAQSFVSSIRQASQTIAPFMVPHMYWCAMVHSTSANFPISFSVLNDHGSHLVLINQLFVQQLGLKQRNLQHQLSVTVAIPGLKPAASILLTEWTKLCLYDPSGTWHSCTLRAVITPSLCVPVILGLLFLSANNIIVDHSARTTIDKTTGFDLLNPTLGKSNNKSLLMIK
jgi:hypothetical protein